MRNIALVALSCAAKLGWGKLQPTASLRPAMENRLCTPPSGVPSAFLMNRTSRTGPSGVMKEGIALVAPLAEAAAICGFGWGTGGLEGLGLVPKAAGCAWQEPQLFELYPGPSPPLPWGTSATAST